MADEAVGGRREVRSVDAAQVRDEVGVGAVVDVRVEDDLRERSDRAARASVGRTMYESGICARVSPMCDGA